MSYVLAVMTHLNSSSAQDVVIKARGRAITTAVDVAEVTRRRFINNIKVDKNQETNFPGIYAAGDVTGGIRQVTTATGEATTAALNAYLFIKKGWYGEGTS